MPKKLRKAIAIVGIFNILYANIVYGVDIDPHTLTRGNVHLSPALKFGDLGDAHHKNLALAEMKLQLYLSTINALTDGGISGVDTVDGIRQALEKSEYISEESTGEDTARTHEPAQITLYFNQVEHVAHHIFAIPVSVTKRGTRSNYTFLFSTVKPTDSGYPVVGCHTLEEFDRQKAGIEAWARRDRVPERKKEDQSIIDRYIQQEINIDTALRHAHEKGFTAAPSAELFDYKERVLELLKVLNIKVTTPEGLTALEEREFFLVERDREVTSMISTVTVVDAAGKKQIVRPNAHSSNYAVHILVSPDYFDVLTGRVSDASADLVKETALENVEMKLAYEIGVMLGFPMLEEGKNIVSERYREYRNLDEHEKPEYLPAEIQATVADLDTTLATRDYAMAENETFPQGVYYFGISGIKPERKAGEASALPYLKHFLEEAARMNVPLAGVEMHGPDHELTEKSLPEVIALLNEYGMGIATISPEIFRDFDPAKGALSSMEIEDRQRAVSLVKRTIDLAVQAECPKVNLWPGLDLATEGERGERYKMLVDSVTECLEYAHKMGVMLTVEPVPLSKRGPAQPIIYDIDQAEDLYLELKNQDAPVENFGIVMDLSHQILADSSATSTSDVLDRQISGLAAWAKHLHEMGIAFWIHANDNYDFEAYVTGKAKAIQDADQDLNVGAEHAADIQALFAYLAEIGYEEIISFDLSPTTESVEGAVKRIRNNITTCDRLYQGERCLDILGKYEQLAQGAISQYQAARQTAQTGKAYALVSIILRTHGNEMRGYLEEGDIEEEKQAMLSELRGAEETDIEMALEMVNAIHIKKGLPANSILVGLCHMLELAKDGKPYDDVRLTMAEPFDLSVVNKYFHLAGETLKGYKGERGDTSETRIAEAMFYAYEKEVRGRLTEESKEQYRARLLKALSEGTSDDAKRAHQFLKDIGIIPFEIQPSKEPLFGQLRDMLSKAMIEIPPTAALLPDQGYYFTFADRGTHYTARSRTRRNAFIDFITRTLAADEIEYLIDTVEERSEQTLYDAETIARLPRLYTILMRLKVALDILDVRHDLPRSLPGKHGLCGTSTLKTALALKRTIEPLPETWVTGEAVDGASFLQLPDERLREMALLEMSAARALLRTHTSRPGFMPASAWKHVPAFAKIMWLGRVRDEHHAMHFTHNFRRATRLRAGVYAVPCMVVRSSKEVLYYAVIFQSGGEQHLFIVTADEMAGMKACQGFGISGVERNAKDSQAMNRYLLHEAGVDAVIHYAHEKGLAKKPAESRFNYRNTVLALQEMLALRIANPGGLTTLEERECYLVKMTGEVRSLMTKTPRARLVDRDGQEHDVHYSEHASNRYVHVFVDEETFDLFTDESAVVEGGVLENRISSIIEPSVVHAIGVMLGLPVTVTDGREIRNVLDERYAEIPLRGAAPFPALEAEIVDLRNTLRTRDYAMEGSPDPLLLGSLGHESLDYKRIALTQRALKEDLAHLHALDAIEGATSLEIVRHAFDENARLNGPQAYNEETIYEPATIEAHFNDVEHVGEHIFSVPLHIGKGGLDTEYRLLFLTKKEEGIYPSVICTERGYALKREAMIEQDALPHRREREEGALHRYLSVNEAVIDTWIREKMQEGDTYIELGRDADDEANERFLDAIHDISYPDEYPDIGKLDRELFDRKIDDILAKVLHERRIILIKVKRGEARPVIRERDKDITVTSHSSQNALYLFLDEMDPTMRKVHLFENLRSYFTSGVFPERTGVRVDGLISSSGASNIADREIAPKLIHEIGVICDMNYDVTKDGRVTNDMDRLYAAAKDVVTRAKHHIPRDLVARVSKGLEAVANLDANLVRRDYAGGETEKSRYLSLTAEATEDLISNLYSKDEDVAGSAHELLTLALLQDASRVVTNTVTSRIMSRVRALGKEEAVTAQVFLKKCSRGDYLLFSLGIERTLSLIRFRQALLRETHFASAFPLARQILAKGPARRDYEKACVLFALMMKCEMMPQLGHAAVEPEAGEAGRALAQAEADTRVMQEIGLKAVNKLLNENDASAHLLLSSMLGSRDTERGWRGVLENALERENRIAQAIGTIRSTSTTETEKKGAYRLLLLACEYGVGLKEIHKKETPLLHGPLSSHISSVHPALAGMAQRFLLAYHDRVKGREAGRRLVTETIANTSGALLANLSKENDAVADDARALLSLALAEKSGKTEEGVRARIRQELAGQVYVKQEKPSLRLLTLGLAYDIERENIEKTIDNTYQHAFEAGTLLAGFCITPYLFGEKELPGTDSFGHEGKKVQKALDQLSKAVTGIASVHEDYEVSGRGGPRRIIEVPYEVKKTRDAYWMITMLLSHAKN